MSHQDTAPAGEPTDENAGPGVGPRAEAEGTGRRGWWTHRRRIAAVAAVVLVLACLAVIPGLTGDRSLLQRFGVGRSDPAPLPPQVQGIRKVVAIGDSVPEGSGCNCATYVATIGQTLTQRLGHQVAAVDDGVGGQTAADLVELLGRGESEGESPDVRHDVRDAQLVVVTVGANDLSAIDTDAAATSCAASCYTPQAQAAAARVGRIVDQVHAAAPGATIAVTNYWNVFADGAAADATERTWSDGVTRAFNTALVGVLRSRPAVLVDTYAPFKGDGSQDPTNLLLADGDHPNAAGHQAIARAVLAAIGVS